MKNTVAAIFISLFLLAACNNVQLSATTTEEPLSVVTRSTQTPPLVDTQALATHTIPVDATLPSPTKDAAPITESATTQTTPGLNNLWLQIVTPLDGEVVTNVTILVNGLAPAGAVISMNDQVTIAAEDQTFQFQVSLEQGLNLLEIVASDPDGNEIYQPITVDYEPGN